MWRRAVATPLSALFVPVSCWFVTDSWQLRAGMVCFHYMGIETTFHLRYERAVKFGKRDP
jgi:hypothetical protein